MNQPLTEQESICCLNTLLVGWEYLECLDKITQTTLYRQGMKQKVSHLQTELRKSLDGALSEVWGVDDTAMFNLLENKKQLTAKIALLRPENKSGLSHVLDEFFKAPESVISRLGIKIIDRDKI